jgi:DNA-binding GntR family transcriptional regulator
MDKKAILADGSGFERPELLAERAAGHIREAIIHGRLEPGQRLVESQLAKQWGVSRAPLREAMRLLTAEGLVALSPHRGATVSPVSPQELQDLFAVREMFESLAARIAAVQRPRADLDRMRQLVAEMDASVARHDLARYYALALEFHDVLVQGSGNAVLVRLYNLVKRQFRRYQAVMARVPHLPERSIREHRKILRAIERGNGRQAASAAGRHIANVAEAFRRHQAMQGGPARRRARMDAAGAQPDAPVSLGA